MLTCSNTEHSPGEVFPLRMQFFSLTKIQVENLRKLKTQQGEIYQFEQHGKVGLGKSTSRTVIQLFLNLLLKLAHKIGRESPHVRDSITRKRQPLWFTLTNPPLCKMILCNDVYHKSPAPPMCVLTYAILHFKTIQPITSPRSFPCTSLDFKASGTTQWE